MQKSLSSIIEEAEKAKGVKAQAKILQANSSAPLKTLIGYAYDPAIRWLLPETNPPFTALHQAADSEGRLYSEARKLIYFVNSEDGRNLTQTRRELMFVQMLETIDAKDAAMLLRVKNKSLTINIEAVKLAFPNMTKDWP